ncbi:hypothetical protein I4F81_000487 [Pyropia yezoensis]|uniref:Uncharacterized protein n=1 Tax=Pyropia yezoensis TaxID=2788 RepID=A0ACC3BIX0_PYRYE|nr:hypothetical protein I4F81_000487 [Neopyropia yezoensis]
MQWLPTALPFLTLATRTMPSSPPPPSRRLRLLLLIRAVLPLTAAAWAVLVASHLPASPAAASRFPFSAAATLPDEEALFAGGRDPFALEPDPFSSVSPGRRSAWARAHAGSLPPPARRGVGGGGAVRSAAGAFAAAAATPLRTAVGVVLVGWPEDGPGGGAEALAAVGPPLRAAAEAAAAAGGGGGCTHSPTGGRCPPGAAAGVSLRLYRAPDVLGRQVAAAVAAGPAAVAAALAAAGSRGGMAALEGGGGRDAAGRPAGTLLYVVSTDLLGAAARDSAAGWPRPRSGSDGRSRVMASTADLLASTEWYPAGVGAVWTTGSLSLDEGALSPAVAAYPAVGVALVSIPSSVNVTASLVPAAAVGVAAAAYGVAAADLRRSGLLEALEGHPPTTGGAVGNAAGSAGGAAAPDPNAELSDTALTAATDVLRAGAVYRLAGTVAAAAAGQVAGLLTAISTAGLVPSSALGASDLAAFGQRLTLAAYKLGAAQSAWASYPPAVPPPGGRRGAAAAAAAAAALAAASAPAAGTHPLAAVVHYAHSALRRESTALDALWGRDVGLDLADSAVCCGRRIDGPRRAARRDAEARALKAEALSFLGGRGRGGGAGGGGGAGARGDADSGWGGGRAARGIGVAAVVLTVAALCLLGVRVLGEMQERKVRKRR